MRCELCGNALKKGERRCSFCGSEAPARRGGWRRTLVIVAIVLAVCAAGYLLLPEEDSALARAASLLSHPSGSAGASGQAPPSPSVMPHP